MKILFVSSECAPFSKSGGLADVAFSLPPALQKTGDDMAIVTPMYRVTQENCGDQFELVKTCSVALGQRNLACSLYRGALNDVPVYAIGNEHLFHRPRLYGYGDDSLRFAFFCRAVIDLLPEFGALPDILHCNDWETALAILYLKNDAVLRPELSRIKTVYTIHNIAYQGQFGKSEMESTFALPSGWYHGGLSYEFEGRQDINLMKGAMLMADAVTTVSPTYARELHYPYFAHGLQGVVDLVDHKLYGILNGIDVAHYNPESDPLVPYHFTIEDRTGKARCKREIQRLFGLNQESEWPLLASVARLVEQKGIELIREILPQLMDMGVQLIVFGQGDPKYIEYFNWAKAQWPGQLGFSSDYNEPTASAVFAGAGEPIPFEEAFDQLRHCYMENERTNRVRHESGYQRVVQITIIGRGAGTFTIRFNENGMQVEPTSASDAEAYVHCSFDNLLAMARGFVTVDKLYLSGQLRLSGNLSKGFEIRYLLSPAKQRA